MKHLRAIIIPASKKFSFSFCPQTYRKRSGRAAPFFFFPHLSYPLYPHIFLAHVYCAWYNIYLSV